MARPDGAIEEQQDEWTSGMEDVLDWDDFEEMLEDGEFASKQQAKEWLATLFLAADWPWHRHILDDVKAGMTKEYRDMYAALPDFEPSLPANTLLNEAKVIDIRSRHQAGEPVSQIAKSFSVSRPAIYDIVNRKTWKDIA